MDYYFKKQLVKKYPDKLLLHLIRTEYPKALSGREELQSLLLYYPHKEKSLRLKVEQELIKLTPSVSVLKKELQEIDLVALGLKYPAISLIPGLLDKLKNTESMGEQLVRRAFEYHFKAPFQKIRPKWLVNPKTRSRLELDGYNAVLKIAFEVNGIHHFKKEFTTQSDIFFKDRLKKRVCKKRNIKLYSIPYFNLPQLIEYLHSELHLSLHWLDLQLKELN